MRARIEDTNNVTRLLLEKAAPYAELDENSRIALSVLHDDGWKTQRIGLEIGIDVTVNATPIARPGTEDALAQAQAKFILLREEMERQKARPWFSAAVAFLACSTLSYFGLAAWASTLAALSTGVWVWLTRCRTKGAA